MLYLLPEGTASFTTRHPGCPEHLRSLETGPKTGVVEGDVSTQERRCSMDLVIRVVEIKGDCPAYEVGDCFSLREGYLLHSDKPLCMHSLASLMPHYNALQVSRPAEWGLAGKDSQQKAYLQCLDPFERTGGGTAIFEITRQEKD